MINKWKNRNDEDVNENMSCIGPICVHLVVLYKL